MGTKKSTADGGKRAKDQIGKRRGQMMTEGTFYGGEGMKDEDRKEWMDERYNERKRMEKRAEVCPERRTS
jgi:hypothetical protein